MDFQTALDNFAAKLQAFWQEDYQKNCPNAVAHGLPLPTVEIQPGPKYVRIVKRDTGACAYCFIARENGDILKPASWKAPAKHARGNIYNANPLEGCGPHGVAYLRG